MSEPYEMAVDGGEAIINGCTLSLGPEQVTVGDLVRGMDGYGNLSILIGTDTDTVEVLAQRLETAQDPPQCTGDGIELSVYVEDDGPLKITGTDMPVNEVSPSGTYPRLDIGHPAWIRLRICREGDEAVTRRLTVHSWQAP